MKRGLRTAIDYLKAFNVMFIPDDLHKLAGIEVMVHTLSHSLRRAARGGKGEVLVSYHPDNSGVQIAYYRWNPDYRPQERPQTTGKATWWWFTLKNVPIASPMYLTVEAMRKDPMYSEGCRTWKGTHEHPILVDIDTHKG